MSKILARVQCCVEKLINYHRYVRISSYTTVFKSAFTHNVCQTKEQPHFSSFLTVQPSTFCSELEKVLNLQPLWGMSTCLHTLTHSHTHWETEMWKAPADPQALQLSSGQIPGSHGLGSVKSITLPAPTFMQHSLTTPSALYSRDQEIHQLTVQLNYIYFTSHPASMCQQLLHA